MAVVTQTIQDQVAELYIGFFGRVADAAGFGYWANELAGGKVTVQQIADGFAKSPEFVSMYDGLTPIQQVTRAYQNVLDRAPDAPGLAYWVNELVNQKTPIGTVVWQIVNAAFVQQGTADGLLVQNKVKVSEYFAVNLASNDTEVAKTAFDGVTSDPKTVIAKEAELDAAVNAGATYTLTTNIETINGTPLNDTFNGLINGANTTLNTGDLLDGKGGTNVLNVSVVDASVAEADMLFQTTRIQEISIRNLDVTNATTINLGLCASLASVGIHGSLLGSDSRVVEVPNAVLITANEAQGNFSLEYAPDVLGSTSANQTFVVNGGSSSLGVRANGSDAFNSATVVANGPASQVLISVSDAHHFPSVLKTLVVGGTGAVNVAIGGGADGFLEKVDASGNSGGVTFDAANLAVLLKTLTGGSGNDVFTLDAAVNNAIVNLGAGDDALYPNGVISSTNIIDGGLGIDTITASSLTAGNAANIKNFEVLNLDNAAGTYDASLFSNSAFQGLALKNVVAGDVAISNLTGTIVKLDVQNTAVLNQLDRITATLASSEGTTDSMAINFTGESNATLGRFVTTGIETASIVTGGSAGLTNTFAGLDVTDNTLTTVTITGANALTLGGIGGAVNGVRTVASKTTETVSSLTLIDGSEATGVLTIRAGKTSPDGFTTYTGLTIKGGAADDFIVTYAKNGVVQTGVGNDTVTTMSVGITINDAVGTDTLVVGAGSNFTGGAVYTTAKLGSITTGFAAGDMINLASVGVTTEAVTNYTTTALTFGSLTDAVNAFIAVGGNGVGYINWVDGNTYLVGDVTAAGTTSATVLELVGQGYSFGTAAVAGVITLA